MTELITPHCVGWMGAVLMLPDEVAARSIYVWWYLAKTPMCVSCKPLKDGGESYQLLQPDRPDLRHDCLPIFVQIDAEHFGRCPGMIKNAGRADFANLESYTQSYFDMRRRREVK